MTSHVSRHRVRRGSRVFLLGVLLLVALLAGAPRSGLAHAYLLEATPAPNAVLATAPGQITLRFGEAIAPAFSTIEVLDKNGERVDARDARVHNEEPTRMSLSLPTLAEGSYTVAWRNISVVDGHTQRGWYVFSIGAPSGGLGTAEVDRAVFGSPAEPIVRWVALLGALALVGGIVFDRAVARPAFDRLRSSEATVRLRQRHAHWLACLLVGGLALWTIGTLLQLPVQIMVATGEPAHRAGVDAFVALLGGTGWGQAWLIRATLLAVTAVLLWRWREGRGGIALPLLASGGALLGMSLASHGATLSVLRPVGLTTDFLHLVAASLWVGGLFALFTLVRLGSEVLPADEVRAFLGHVLPRFSLLAILSVVTLAVTGMVLAWLHVQEPAALDSPYGRLLIAKTVLFLTMLGIGAVNLFWTTREVERHRRGPRWLGRLVGAEAGIAVAVILTVAALTSMEPARTAAAGTTELVETSDEVTVTLRLDSADVGSNRLSIFMEGRQGAPVSPHHVAVRLDYLVSEIGELVQNAREMAPGHYVADVPLSAAGEWSVEVFAPRTDGFDVRAGVHRSRRPRCHGEPPSRRNALDLDRPVDRARRTASWRRLAPPPPLPPTH
jgi:copper transport protein